LNITSVLGTFLREGRGGDAASQSSSSIPEFPEDSSLSDDTKGVTPKSLSLSAVGSLLMAEFASVFFLLLCCMSPMNKRVVLNKSNLL
jgi:hypothetical protein